MNLADIRGVVSDMDGVLWRGDEPLPGLVPFFELLRQRRIPFALATNNSGKAPADYVAKLARMGVRDVPEATIVTSGTVSVDYLRQHHAPDVRVHVLGGDGLRHVLREGGFMLVDEDAQVVIVGVDFNLTYEKLKRAALLIRRGAAFIATNVDATYPMPEGLAPGAGSLVAALVTATDCQPVIMGKPEAPMFEAALHVLGTLPGQTLMIGDRLNTDIEGAARLGFRTALVLTGVASREQAAAVSSPPDGVYEDLNGLIQAFGG